MFSPRMSDTLALLGGNGRLLSLRLPCGAQVAGEGKREGQPGLDSSPPLCRELPPDSAWPSPCVCPEESPGPGWEARRARSAKFAARTLTKSWGECSVREHQGLKCQPEVRQRGGSENRVPEREKVQRFGV